MGDPRIGGSVVGEGTGIRSVTITREELTIDMRAVAESSMVAVSATYHLDNPGDAKQLDVVFVTGIGRALDFVATVDGKALATRPMPVPIELPPHWMLPEYTRRGMETVGIRLEIPTGRHDVAVTYKAPAVLYHRREPTLRHQFPYILAPARTWGGFGGLDITVLVPAGWDAEITPPLKRAGDRFIGSFSSIPADSVLIEAHAPEAPTV